MTREWGGEVKGGSLWRRIELIKGREGKEWGQS